jgi:hypothetical protein
LDTLDELRQEFRNDFPATDFDAVLLKAALVHGATWGDAREVLDDALAEVPPRRRSDVIARMVGYGYARPEWALRCDDHRVTGVAAARISDGEAHAYRFPLPSVLSSVTTHRRLTLTLAWLSPINADHRSYRRAALKLEPNQLPAKFAERTDVGQYAGWRGTVQHECLSGRAASPYAADKAVELLISCRADAGELLGSVPYAVLATLEVPEGVRVYQQVRQRLRPVVPIRPTL